MSAASNILVVEDNDVSRKLIVAILNKAGYPTLEAVDGYSGLTALDETVSLILLDLEMSPLNGFGFVQQMEIEKPQFRKLPIVLITADQSSDLLMSAGRLGIRHVMGKPITPEKLMQKVERILGAPPAAAAAGTGAAGTGTAAARASDRRPHDVLAPETFMRKAIELSQRMMRANEGGPFGAVVVKDGQIVGEGWNRVTSQNDPTAHAEITAIREACRTLKTWSLEGCEIYTSCEPCPMCLAAIYWARLDRMYYANTRDDAAAIGFDDAMIYGQVSLPPEERILPSLRILADDALRVFAEWQKKPDRKMY